MNDILEELYMGYFLEQYKPSPETRATTRKEGEALGKLLPGLGGDTVEELQARQSETLISSNLDWFREGFRLGVALMMEVL